MLPFWMVKVRCCGGLLPKLLAPLSRRQCAVHGKRHPLRAAQSGHRQRCPRQSLRAVPNQSPPYVGTLSVQPVHRVTPGHSADYLCREQTNEQASRAKADPVLGWPSCVDQQRCDLSKKRSIRAYEEITILDCVTANKYYFTGNNFYVSLA